MILLNGSVPDYSRELPFRSTLLKALQTMPDELTNLDSFRSRKFAIGISREAFLELRLIKRLIPSTFGKSSIAREVTLLKNT
jgi:hypothetical protein